MVIDTRLYGTDQNCIQSDFAKLLNRFELRLQQGRTTESLIAGIFKCIELQIDFRPVFPFGDTFQKRPITGQANAVCVNHHDVDRLIAGVAMNRCKVRMNCWLATRQLQDFSIFWPRCNFDDPPERAQC